MAADFLKSKVSIEFYKFIFVGIFATLVNYSLFYILLNFCAANYLIAAACGFISGVFVGYRLNRQWTFRLENEKNYFEIIRYFSVYLFSLFLSLLCLKYLVGVAGLRAQEANILVIGLTTFTNFMGLKLVVFT